MGVDHIVRQKHAVRCIDEENRHCRKLCLIIAPGGCIWIIDFLSRSKIEFHTDRRSI